MAIMINLQKRPQQYL